ncbi:MAG: UDP-N-acetylmuramoyl-tripeptide--D-alanyl-D-alanine ligase [Pseudomonadota bacterium]
MSAPLWTAADAAAATGGQVLGDWSGVTGVSIDTREIAPGDLFVALTGDNRDGHQFVAQALEAGAGAAMVSRKPEGIDGPMLLVDDALKALEALGIAARARTEAKVIAVTGSVGKTSTKEMLRSMLASQGKTHAAVRSFNNHWGVPLTLARMPADTKYAVIEIGMNQPGEITPLSRMARPHVALITTVEAVHLAAFDSVEQIADAKAEIFAGLEPEGKAVLPADNEHFERLAAAAGRPVLTFGAGQADAVLAHARVVGEQTALKIQHDNASTEFKMNAPGVHFALNATGAMLAAEAAGADWAQSAQGLTRWSPPKGRGSKVSITMPDGGITLLDESYNANPASMRAALAVLATVTTTGRKQAFLGDMLELGPTEKALHADLAKEPALRDIDKIHCCGALMKAAHDALAPDKQGLWCPDSAQLAADLPGHIDPGDVCMVKGSLGARMALVVDAIKALGENRDAPEGKDL